MSNNNQNRDNTFRETDENGAARQEPAKAEKKIKVGITHGDFNGIGYETILKMLEDNRILDLCTIIIYGSAKIASFYRKILGDSATTGMAQINRPAEARADIPNIINVIGQEAHIEPGQASREAGEAAFAAIERAVADLNNGEIDLLVTAPINKNSIQSELFNFPGHTEYLAAAANSETMPEPLMLLCAGDLRVAVVTTHTPISKLSEAITQEAVFNKIKLLEQSLIQDFSIVKPRIAVLGLNPHAGEGGLLGDEELSRITPAIEQARQEGIHAFGPYPADGFFGNGLYKHFDGVLAMYHDQGLAPFKTIAMDEGVNFTAGLPFVRTSPDHGTGYDIAGKGVASPQSMRNAIYLAIDVLRSRRNYSAATANPLKKLYHERGRGEGGSDKPNRAV